MRILIALPLMAVLAWAACTTKSEPGPAPKSPVSEAGKPAAATTTDFVLDRVP